MEQKRIKAWWPTTPLPGNAGDIITPFAIQHINREPCKVPGTSTGGPTTTPCLIGCGSIAKFARPGVRVWGSGIMRRSDPIDPEATWIAIRGPETLKALRAAGFDKSRGLIVGDPGLCLPLLYTPEGRRGGMGQGICLHYADMRDEKITTPIMYGAGPTHIIGSVFSTLFASPKEFVAHICQHTHIHATSLHGMIIAHAYGIPARWYRAGENLSGDGVKFSDYLQSVGLDEYDPVFDPDPIWSEHLPAPGVVERIGNDLMRGLVDYANGYYGKL